MINLLSPLLVRLFNKKHVIIIASGYLLFTSFCHAATSHHQILSQGKITKGAYLVNGQLTNGKIQTKRLATYGWGKPRFEIRGLSIDLSNISDLAQVKLQIIIDNQTRPNYADIVIYNSKNQASYLTNFPFKAYNRQDEMYMSKSLLHCNHYDQHPDGAYLGKITGLGINIDQAMQMSIKSISLIITNKVNNKEQKKQLVDTKNWHNGQLKQAYAISISDRIFQDEINSSLANENSIWQQGKVILAGAKNETVAFQLVLEAAAGQDGLNDLNVHLDHITNPNYSINNNQAIAPKDPYNYVNKPIQLYRSHYIKIFNKTDIFTEQAISLAAGTLGRYSPVMQIPFEAKWGGAPFSLFPATTQSLLIDIYIPPQTPSGKYAGQINITEKQQVIHTIPITLTVHDFTLPNKASVTSFMFSNDLYFSRHGVNEANKPSLITRYRQFFRRHHTELQFKSTYASAKIFTKDYGYEGRNYNLAANYAFLTFYGLGKLRYHTKEQDWHQELRQRKQALGEEAQQAKTVLYTWDEPHHNFIGGIPAFKQWLNQITPFIQSFNKKSQDDMLVYATTWRNDIGADSALNAYAAKTEQEYKAMQQEGVEHWQINHIGTLQDYVAVSRFAGWQAFAKAVDVWWAWESTHVPTGFNIYKDSKNFLNQYGEYGVGDGLLIYPGTDKLNPNTSPELSGPIGGLRFYNWRQGFIDYEYLHLAEQQDPLAVKNIIKQLIHPENPSMQLPNNLGYAKYPINNNAYQKARAQLVDIILSNKANLLVNH